MKTRKAFTLIEAVITIGILSVSLALSAVAFSNLGRIQETATDQVVANRELNKADEFVSRYVSFVSIKTDDISFSSTDTSSSNTIVFTLNGTTNYNLSFIDKRLSVSNDYSGESDYFKYSESEEMKYISEIVFDYDSSLGLLISSVKYLNNKNIRYSYVVRTAS